MTGVAPQRHARQRGGLSQLFLGFLMMCGGGYLLLQSIMVTEAFSLGIALFHVPGMPYGGVTSGMILIPFLIGVGMLFYDSDQLLGWALALGSLCALLVGVIVNTHFSLRTMSAFEMLTILILLVGGLGLFLRAYAGLKKQQGV